MDEVFARVDDVFARIIRQGGLMTAERFDPAGGRFVSDVEYFSKLMSPEHAGVDSYQRMTKEEFDSEINKLKG